MSLKATWQASAVDDHQNLIEGLPCQIHWQRTRGCPLGFLSTPSASVVHAVVSSTDVRLGRATSKADLARVSATVSGCTHHPCEHVVGPGSKEAALGTVHQGHTCEIMETSPPITSICCRRQFTRGHLDIITDLDFGRSMDEDITKHARNLRGQVERSMRPDKPAPKSPVSSVLSVIVSPFL